MPNVMDSVTAVKGVGHKKAELLAKLGIHTVADLLTHFPFRYEDVSIKSLDELEDGQKATIAGQVVTQPVVQYYGRKRNRLSFRLRVDQAVLSVVFFNQPYLKKKIHMEEELVVYGRYDMGKGQLNGFKIFNQQADDNDVEAIYHVTQGLSQKTLMTYIANALATYQSAIPERLPYDLRAKYHLISHSDAIKNMHFPESEEKGVEARRQIKYEEFFLYALRLQWQNHLRRQVGNGAPIIYDNQQLKQFIETIPFELTKGQKQVVNEICADLRQDYQMNRLLQGDVGSGKTVVALIALMATYLAGFQGALMVPTEILAEQHFASLSEFFADTSINLALLTGSTATKQRRQILADLKNGDCHIVIGTHALIQADVAFDNLGLVVVDEQHRFGVKQRQQLAAKGEHYAPNILYMTATPIPRTLEITIMGDMEVSKLQEMPNGRLPIKTAWMRKNQQAMIDELLREQLASGRQAYVICPLIGESEALEAQNAEYIYQEYLEKYGHEYHVGILHGKMSNEDKDAAMNQFKDNETQILVSTTVIEVGVNVPNATFMIVLDADRFGLAQLHQLRGRVGRGEHQSYCVLVADPKTDNGRERMRIMASSTDGFYLSQQDLVLRGAGDYFGTKQSGLPEFKLADPIADQVILETARQDAQQFLPILLDHADDYPQLSSWLATMRADFSA